MTGINLAERLDTFVECWQPKTVGQFNGHDNTGNAATAAPRTFV